MFSDSELRSFECEICREQCCTDWRCKKIVETQGVNEDFKALLVVRKGMCKDYAQLVKDINGKLSAMREYSESLKERTYSTGTHFGISKEINEILEKEYP